MPDGKTYEILSGYGIFVLMEIERDIIAGIKAGDPSGLRKLFEVYYRPLCSYALNFIDSFEEAEDVVQDFFVCLWEKRSTLNFGESLKSYLYVSVRNNSIRKRAALGKSKLIPYIEKEFELPDTDFESPLYDMEEIMASIRKLPPRAREVFHEIVFNGMSYKQAGLKLGMSLNTVKTHFSRALKQLRYYLAFLFL